MKLPKITKITRTHKHIPEALQERKVFNLIGRNPYVDWVGSIMVSMIVATALIIMGCFVYLGVENSLNEPVSTSKTNDKVAKEMKILDRVVKEFDDRANAKTDLSHGYAGVGDPSI